MSKAKSLVGKFLPKKTAASIATIMSPAHVMDENSQAFSPSITQRTPKHKLPKPSFAEMHPEHQHKASTPFDEAPWLGFFKMQPKTEPPRPKDLALPKYVPTSPSPKQLAPEADPFKGPNFSFTFSKSMQLSPETKKLMEETREEAARIRQTMIRQKEDEEMQEINDRKIAVPKGKVGRFSDIHLAEFKKMDSIANHPSKWRATASATKLTTGPSLKRSPSKADLDKATPSKILKRSPSKAELDRPTASSTLKRSPSKIGLNSAIRTPGLRHVASRGDLTKLRTAEKPVFVTKSPTNPTPAPAEAERSVKRAKFAVKDDVSTSMANDVTPTKSFACDRRSVTPTPSQSRLLTSTKASLARAQSVRSTKISSKIPSLVRSNSINNLSATPSPSKMAYTPFHLRSDAPSPSPMKMGIPLQPATPSPAKSFVFKLEPTSARPTGIPSPNRAIRSILRTPQRLYSDDPSKIAAGTHLATPPDMMSQTLHAPATAPVIKHVVFSVSAREKAARDEAMAASVEPEPLYPDLSSNLKHVEPTSRRMTFSAPIRKSPNPGEFTFRSGAPMNFPSTSPTIRPVRVSDAAAIVPGSSNQATNATMVLNNSTKRKVDQLLKPVVEEGNKENFPAVEPDEEDSRPAKRARKGVAEKITNGAKTSPTSKRPVPRAPPKKKPTAPPRAGDNKRRNAAGISASRLAYLAMPKKRA